MAEVAQPQWDSAEYDTIRLNIQNCFACSQEEAIARLRAMWNNEDQQRPPTPPPPPEPIPPQDDGPQAPAQKKTTFTDFDLNSSIPGGLPFFPAPFAIKKVKTMDYIELWYFTLEGIQDASRATLTAADDTFGLLRTNSGLTLQQIKATRTSRNVIRDDALTWEQISTAQHNILNAATSWPEKHCVVLAKFFINLEALKATSSNPRALILYQAVSCQQWHAALKGQGQPFNLSIINSELLTKLENQIRDLNAQETQNQASKNSSPPHTDSH